MVSTINTSLNNSYKSNTTTMASPFAQFEIKMATTPLVSSNTALKADTVVTTKKTPVTSANDGKFSAKVAMNNFIKGVFSPITSMFNSYKSLAIGMGTIAVGAGLCSVGFAPALIALGVFIGGLQAATTLYQLVKAKNGDDVEKACYGAGVATSTLGLSVIGAKGALRSVNQNTSNLTTYKAITGCFKQTPKAFNNLFGAIKSNLFKNPFVNASEITINDHIARIENANTYQIMDKKVLTSTVQDPYKVLGVRKTATDSEIKTAYKALAQLFHPDKQSTGNENLFKTVSSSYSMLKSAASKSSFDHAFAEQRISLTPTATILQTFNRKD